MNYRYLIYSILLLIGAKLFYILNKDWKKHMNKNKEGWYWPSVRLDNIKQWIGIIMLVIWSIILFFKSFL